MIPTLIVEDDHLVRQGLRHMFPWNRYEMEVIGEAENGEAALDFIYEHEVQLVLTDLTMPVMSGFELMQEINARFPHIWIVVLTCHQDFDYIQEALRMGAIDYIVKTQLQAHTIEEVLSRIHERIRRDTLRIAETAEARSSGTLPEWGLLLYDHSAKEDGIREIWWLDPKCTIEVREAYWFVYMSDLQTDWREKWQQLEWSRWSAMEIRDLNGQPKHSLTLLLDDYIREHWFYEMDHKKMQGKQTMAWMRAFRAQSEAWDVLRREWLAFKWIFDEKPYKLWVAQIKTVRPPQETIVSWFWETIENWEHFGFLLEKSVLLQKPAHFRYWSEWEDWFQDIRSSIGDHFESSRYSEEVFAAILRAVDLMGRHVAGGLNQTEVAGWVNLSRSYFSAVFKDIVGKTFNEYLRDLRIARAKRLMARHKHKPIYWIAEQAGFQDEGYFSRVFREHTGMLPSEYRLSSLL